ncbi:MAG: sel1 repeat family protein [Gammaproteobacteria bacterium]|nr:sel1 repeat family protein [Gammaproteobacteria bacterium]
MDYLAGIYFHGRGVNKSYEKSYQWISRSGGANTAEKHYFIGFLSLKGHVLNKNLKEAHRHLLIAAEAGHADAQFQLGEMYRLGEHVETNDDTALSWLKKAMQQNHVSAELAIKKIERKREHEDYANQQKRPSFNVPQIEIKVIGLPKTKAQENPARQNNSGGWGLHILLFFIVLIAAAILLVRNRSSSNHRMTEHEKEVINQALKSRLEKQSTNKAQITQPVVQKDEFYDNSLLDIAKQELEMNTIDKALWDQVSSEANGDMAKAELLYLKKRVKALMDARD